MSDEVGEAVLAGLRSAVGADPDEAYTVQEMLERIARTEGFRLVPRGAYVPTEGEQIYPAVIEAMRHVGAVAKLGEYKESRDGPVQYRFRGVDAVVNAAGPAFRKAGVIPVPTILTAARTPGTTKGGGSKMTTVIRVRYAFFAADGSSISLEVEGEANDTSDKGTGKAFSVAYRIALLQLLAIPTDDPDPDATRIEGDHTPPLSAALARYLTAKVATGPLDQLEELWTLLTAHVAPDARVNPEDAQSTVWWELWARRYQAEVEAAAPDGGPTGALRDLWQAIGPFGRAFRIGDGRNVNKAITEATMRWGERQRMFVDEVFSKVRAAETPADLDDATELVKLHLAEKAILPADSLSILEVIEKARGRMAEVARAAEEQTAENLASWGDDGERGPSTTDLAIENYHGDRGLHE